MSHLDVYLGDDLMGWFKLDGASHRTRRSSIILSIAYEPFGSYDHFHSTVANYTFDLMQRCMNIPETDILTSLLSVGETPESYIEKIVRSKTGRAQDVEVWKDPASGLYRAKWFVIQPKNYDEYLLLFAQDGFNIIQSGKQEPHTIDIDEFF